MTFDIEQRLTFATCWPVEALRATLTHSRKVVLVAHTNADGDAVGSVTGMMQVLSKTTTCQVTAILPDGVPDDLMWLPCAERVLNGHTDADACRDAIEAADTVVALDVNSLDRCNLLADQLKSSKAVKLLIDHHIDPARDQFAHIVSEPEASSTCELVYWTMRECFGDEAFDSGSATSFYTGICTDTGTFSFSNDRPSVYLAAARLLAYGVDPMRINRNIKNVFTLQRMRFFGHAMDSLMTVDTTHGVALMVISAQEMRDYGVTSAELTGLINEVMRLRDIDCGILIREEEHYVRLSLRSKERYDVNRLAREFYGGGGHERAAGATSHMSLADTVKHVKQKLGLLATMLLLTLNIALLGACSNVPVVETAPAQGDSLTERLINANRYISGSEKQQIDSYVNRRGWQMATLTGGTRVMEATSTSSGQATSTSSGQATSTSSGQAASAGTGLRIEAGDTVAVSYRLEAIDGKVIYSHVTDTVVAGRMMPTRGLDAALLTLSYGSEATVIVPSEQGYGVMGDGDRVGRRMILVYKELRIENNCANHS